MAASNTRFTQNSLGQSKTPIDSDHGIYRDRRAFITLLGGVAAAWPLAARAQQAAMPVIGFLSSLSLAATERFLAAFQQALKEAGYVEGQSLTVEYRWAEGQYDRLPALTADLLRQQVAMIAAFGPPAALAAKAATAIILIVFVHGSDPVQLGLVASLNRPGGNVTGINFFSDTLEPKRLEPLHELVPGAALIGVLFNPTRSDIETQSKDIEAAARAIGTRTLVLRASATLRRSRQLLPSNGSAHYSSAPTRSSPPDANKLSRWRFTTESRQFMNCANSSWPAG